MLRSCACAPAGADRRSPRVRWLGARGLGLAGISGLSALLPKCPLCLVPYLSLFGLSVSNAALLLELLPFAAAAGGCALIGAFLVRYALAEPTDEPRVSPTHQEARRRRSGPAACTRGFSPVVAEREQRRLPSGEASR